MLYELERHEPLRAVAWDEARVRLTIAAIVADAETCFDPQQLWPIHPLDHSDTVTVSAYKSLYIGAAGVLWATQYLADAAVVSLQRDYDAHLDAVHAAYREAPESLVVMPSYLLGESGILLAQWRHRPSVATADQLYVVIRDNIAHPSNELMLGAPGTMLATLFLYEWTAEDRWLALFRDSVDVLWSVWNDELEHGCHLWTQQLFGSAAIHVGAVHGFAGNAAVLLRGAHLLPASQRAELYRRCAEVLEKTAQVEGEDANWPQSAGTPRPGHAALLVQWCNGAPGMIGSFRDFPIGHAPRVERLLVQGGELIWTAGPLTKGPGLCHGTAGNGYGLLELYRRTGDRKWLDRARAFGMHAIEQYTQMRVQYGQGRYSLWTGDVGLAIYLWHCLCGTGGFPSVAVL